MDDAYAEYGEVFDSAYTLVTAEDYASRITGKAAIVVGIGFFYMTFGILGIIWRNGASKAKTLWNLGVAGACLFGVMLFVSLTIDNVLILIDVAIYLVGAGHNSGKYISPIIEWITTPSDIASLVNLSLLSSGNYRMGAVPGSLQVKR